MTVALYVLGVLIFVIGVGVSIGLHEIGHLVPAKRFGVKVTQYMVGFGPTMWSRQRGETEYGVKAIPLGGYIRMVGMYPPAPGADPTMLRASTTGRFRTLIDDARQQSLEEVGPADSERVFYKLPVIQRVVIMLGGPMMNLALAFVLFTIVLSIIGTTVGLDGEPNVVNRVGAVTACVPTKGSPSGALNAQGVCGPTTSTPAAAAGMRAGDTIVSVAGTATPTWPQVQEAIHRIQPRVAPLIQRPQKPRLAGDPVRAVDAGLKT